MAARDKRDEKMKGIKGLKEDLARMKEEIREEMREQEGVVRKEIEGLRKELKELRNKTVSWYEERREMKEKMES